MNIKIPFIVLIFIFTVNSTILITSPAKNDFENSTIPYSFANFGKIPYGKTLSFTLSITKVNLCQNLSKVQHLKQATYLLIDASLGTCSFTVQSLNAQLMGAQGIIFASDMVKYYDKIIPADDGNGKKVQIPVIFISTDSYKKLQYFQKITIKVLYEVHKTDKVLFTYFLSASGRQNYIFLRQFYSLYQKIKQYVIFKPIYITFECDFCQTDDCFVSNKYCNFQMDIYQQKVGSLIIREQLRQWNIWKKQGTESYLKYMDQFDKLCTYNWLSSQECGKNIIKNLKLNDQKFSLSPTQLMDEWRSQQISGGFFSTPEISINHQLFGGSYIANDVFKDICANLENPPEICNPTQQGNNNHFIIIIVVIIAVTIVCLFIGALLYRRCVKKELTKDMFSKVNQLVAHYATKVSEHNKKRKERLKMRLTEQL